MMQARFLLHLFRRPLTWWIFVR